MSAIELLFAWDPAVWIAKPKYIDEELVKPKPKSPSKKMRIIPCTSWLQEIVCAMIKWRWWLQEIAERIRVECLKTKNANDNIRRSCAQKFNLKNHGFVPNSTFFLKNSSGRTRCHSGGIFFETLCIP